jgi:hypothetical protein
MSSKNTINTAILFVTCMAVFVGNDVAFAFSTFAVKSRHYHGFHHSSKTEAKMGRNNNLNDDIERVGRQKAQGGMGETVAGAVLGGLLLGPFGALFGAQLGSKVGAVNAVDKAKNEEMARLGVSDEMLKMAEEIGTALERSLEGFKASQDSIETQQSLARRLDVNANELYEKAKIAMVSTNEEQAKKLLLDRQMVQEKLKKVLLTCADEQKRLSKMRSNVDALEQRAMEIESLLARTIGAKALKDSSSQFSLSQEDPLLQKFRDMGIE